MLSARIKRRARSGARFDWLPSRPDFYNKNYDPTIPKQRFKAIRDTNAFPIGVSRIWRNKNPKISDRSRMLIEWALYAAVTERTRKNYAYTAAIVSEWGYDKDVSPLFPMDEETCLLWAADRLDEGISARHIKKCFSHLKDFHNNWYYPHWDWKKFPTLVRVTDSWMRCVLNPKERERKPVLLIFFHRFLTSHPFNHKDLFSVAFFTLLLCLWWTLARGAELCTNSATRPGRLRTRWLADLDIEDDHMIISLPISKGDVFSRGADLLIPRVHDHPLCPYRWMMKLLKLRQNAGLDTKKRVPLFPDHNGHPITVELARREFFEFLRKIGENENDYNLHSFRIGAATEFFRRGMSTELIKNLGRWRGNTVEIYNRPSPKYCAQLAREIISKSIIDDRRHKTIEFGDESYFRN